MGEKDKIKWMAFTGYILVFLDAFITNVFYFYQFYIFGWNVNALTLSAIVIYFFIQKANDDNLIFHHVKKSVHIYKWYILLSILSSFFVPIMIIALLYVALSCALGTVNVLKEINSIKNEQQANES